MQIDLGVGSKHPNTRFLVGAVSEVRRMLLRSERVVVSHPPAMTETGDPRFGFAKT